MMLIISADADHDTVSDSNNKLISILLVPIPLIKDNIR